MSHVGSSRQNCSVLLCHSSHCILQHVEQGGQARLEGTFQGISQLASQNHLGGALKCTRTLILKFEEKRLFCQKTSFALGVTWPVTA